MEERGFNPETLLKMCSRILAITALCLPQLKLVRSHNDDGIALAFSKNCASAYIMKQVTPKAFEDFVARIGIPTDIGPSSCKCAWRLRSFFI
jgi:penicillin-binding protein 1A